MAVHNTIRVQDKRYTIFGDGAHRFVLAHRQEIERARAQSKADPILFGRCLVFDPDGTMRAAQSTENGAEKYMTPDRIMVLL